MDCKRILEKQQSSGLRIGVSVVMGDVLKAHGIEPALQRMT